MSLSVVVMAHPSRRAFVDDLLSRLDGPARVVWDRRDDFWDTGRRALLAHVETDAEWSLTIQDDAIPCADMVAGAGRALALAGEQPVSFYLGAALAAKYPPEGTWLEMQGPWGGVAVALPTAHIADIVEWGDQRSDVPSYDKRIARWYGARGVKCLYSVPSLVDHRSVALAPSLMPRGRKDERHAHCFLGERSALEVEWDAP